MKVGELVEKLKRLDADMDIFGFADDEQVVTPDYIFRLLDIEGVATINGEMKRERDQFPTLHPGDTELSKKIAILRVTIDF